DWYGSEEIVFTATDSGGLSDKDTVSFTINPVNDAPILSGIPDIEFNEDDSTTIILSEYVEDIDTELEELTFTADIIEVTGEMRGSEIIRETDSSGNVVINVGEEDLVITIDNETKEARIEASSDSSGIFVVEFIVTDDSLASGSDTINVEVKAVNDGPEITGIPDQELEEGEIFSNILLDDYVEDIDDNKEDIVWTYRGNVELAVDIDENRVVSLTQPDEDWYGSEEIVFTATDSGGLSDKDTVSFTIDPVNDAPILSGMPDIEFNEDDSTTIILSEYAEDVDTELEDLTFTADILEVTGEMRGSEIIRETDNSGNLVINVGEEDLVITIDNETKEARIEASSDSSGIFIVEFIVTDDSLASGRDTINIEVKPVNDAPKIISTPVDTVTQGNEYVYNVEAVDIDKGDELTFILTESPSFLSIGSLSGKISGIPGEQDVGTHNVTIQVEDIEGAYDNQTFELTVKSAIECGDVNCDGEILVFDAALLLRFILGLDQELICSENGDVDMDGTLTAFDCANIARYAIGLNPLVLTCFENSKSSSRNEIKGKLK
ncbi:Ig-like domain-containing protein, partial [Bacteroidota bacterium]